MFYINLFKSATNHKDAHNEYLYGQTKYSPNQIMNQSPKGLYAPLGFTLIELMIVVVIIAIMAAIATPSYQRYVVKNAESKAQAKMKQLEMDLERWQANALTYKGFTPRKVATDGTISYSYDTITGKKANTAIYVPDGSNANTYAYIITIDDNTNKKNSLSGSRDLTKITVGNSWRMYAEPNSNLTNANKMLLKSNGIQCKSKVSSFTLTADCTEAGAEKW